MVGAAERGEGGPDAGHGGHTHGVSAQADRRWLYVALGLIAGFMVAEVIIGLLAGSLALLTDAGHMLTDAAAIGLALVAGRLAERPARGRYTYGFNRAEILSAQANGITLLLLTVWFVIEGIQRMVTPAPVAGGLVFVTGLVGIVVNLAATWSLSRANRTSLNVEGAFQHILNDLFAFVATAVAGVVVWLTGFARADAIAALLVACLMAKAGWGLIRESGQVFLEAAPPQLHPDAVGARLAGQRCVVEVHDLHIWQITSGSPALSAHVLVQPSVDCHHVRERLERVLHEEYGLEHTTLQLDHADSAEDVDGHCTEPHGAVFRDAAAEELPDHRPGPRRHT